MSKPDLTADCSRCAALCCVTLSFDKSDKFAFDKPAGVPCRHLAQDHTCTIHDHLEEAGFAGCVQYDCQGAGQRVVQDLFGGRSWRDDPSLLEPMSEAFRAMRTIHEMLALLRTASRLTLTASQHERLQALEDDLLPPEGWTPETLKEFMKGASNRDLDSFLKSLRAVAGKEKPRHGGQGSS
ncbi:hypothetical protein [Henriciella mobilis]|uniref:Pentapeptide repeat-containing protein n=1 Tax=Henriciella mobilis TaxID=2305467 RepID=A0A399R811_9PROT|nr:hypothetical protein [Henriciella mobilis]RIJ14924.1 hypothetical protein D1231_15015 [Henriciella mobilis]RIJ21879.1 hypothetical protein D1227_10155 [Henriciella mobilis]RIJ26621.1 hypothetical protein D1223_16840 [Henriciella mobilis]